MLIDLEANRYLKAYVTQFKVIPPKTLGIFLSQQVEEENFFFIPDYGFYVFSRMLDNGYGLLFVLNKLIKIEKLCSDTLDWADVNYIKKDVPWIGFSTKFTFTLLPIDCERNIAMPAVKVYINSGDTIFHWDQIVNILFTEELINYLEKIKNEKGVEYYLLNT